MPMDISMSVLNFFFETFYSETQMSTSLWQEEKSWESAVGFVIGELECLYRVSS